MQRRKYVSFVVWLIVFALSACSTQPTQAPPTAVPMETVPAGHGITSEERELPLTETEVPRISVEEAKAALESGAAVMVDVRSSSDFEDSHVAGAVSVPLGVIERDLANVPLGKEQWIITYCTWQNEHQSARAAFLLLHNGYLRVEALLGGFTAWDDAGLPIEP